jgi:DNA-directed RNA polymerase specialized sigma24 family protein
MALLRRLCRNQHDAEDAFQQTALRVWRSFASRPWLRNPRAWLMRIAYRTFLDQQSKRTQHEWLQDITDDRLDNPHRGRAVGNSRSRECSDRAA